MALRIVANRPDPALVTLPWSLPLEEWSEHVVPLPRGLSRHVVRIVRLGGNTSTPSRRRSRRSPSASTACCATSSGWGCQRWSRRASSPGGSTTHGEELPAALLTQHLRFSLPYRSLFSHGLSADNLPSLVDAMVVLLVRLHLADFYWGDVSLSNVLFRRSAGGFAAYLVDAETGELKSSLSDTTARVRPDHRDRERLRRAARPPGQRVAGPRGRGARHRRDAHRALHRAVGRADLGGGVLGRRDVAHRAARRAAQRVSASTSTSSTSSPTATATGCGSSRRSSSSATTVASCRR